MPASAHRQTAASATTSKVRRRNPFDTAQRARTMIIARSFTTTTKAIINCDNVEYSNVGRRRNTWRTGRPRIVRQPPIKRI